jgi:hypothetical protein
MTAPPEKNIPTKLEWFAAAVVTLAILWLHFHSGRMSAASGRDEGHQLARAGV